MAQIKKPSKPKFKKYPKMPKASASPEAWKNYENRAKAIDVENNKKIAEYKKKLAAYESAMKKKESVKAFVAKAKAKLSGF